jgi:hypothetical protein
MGSIAINAMTLFGVIRRRKGEAALDAERRVTLDRDLYGEPPAFAADAPTHVLIGISIAFSLTMTNSDPFIA